MANMRIAAVISKKFRLFGVDTRGFAGIDFAITGLLLALGLVNAVDVGFYAYRRMEVENAAEASAQAAWKTCHPNTKSSTLPATINCAALNTAITAAIQSTSLGTKISLASGYPVEDYRCVNTSNALQFMGSVSSPPPADCSAVRNPSASPGDYIQVQVTYAYSPLFPGLSVMGGLGISSITKTSWMRLG